MRHVIAYQKKRKERDRDGVFVAEGERLVTEVPDRECKELYVSASFHAAMSGETKRFFARHRRIAQVVPDAAFAKMSDTKTPQGILAVVRQRQYSLDALLAGKGAGTEPSPAGPVLILEEIQDPGNLGTILRASEAADVSFVILAGNTVDRYSPKAVRATMGSIFRVPVVRESLSCAAKLKEAGYTIAAADTDGAVSYDAYNWTGKSALIIGNEANGLSEEAKQAADIMLKIPMAGKNESLNAAVCASVMLFEAARQRRVNVV